MDIIKWLKLGLFIFLSFNNPQLKIIDDNSIVISTQISNLLTQEMKELLYNGVDFNFRVYSSVIAIDNNNREDFIKNIQYRKINYDFITEKYLYSINDEVILKDKNLNTILDSIKRFEFQYKINYKEYKALSFFIEISLLDDAQFKEKFNINTSKLWERYTPSIKADFNMR